jgi:hypothetical protein
MPPWRKGLGKFKDQTLSLFTLKAALEASI